MESLIQYLIICHAGLGGLALLSGAMALAFQKGKLIHRKSGKVFYFSMLFSAVLALIISCLPKHESPFLFCIGLFSSYFILSGYRALSFNKSDLNLKPDRMLTWLFIVTCFIMFIYAFSSYPSINIVNLIFGIFGVIFAFADLRSFKNIALLKRNRIRHHLGKMIGGYIAASTAFVVVNQLVPGIYGWFLPGIIGGMLIYYWLGQYKTT